MSKRKTPEEYYKECKSKGLDLPIEDYVNNKTKINHKCKKGHIYKQSPSKHLNGQGCKVCKGNILKTPDKYYNECKEKGLDLPIEDYVNATTKIKHKCNKCGKIYDQKPNNHLQGQECPYCSGVIKKTNAKYYYKECKEKGLDLPIEGYKGARIEIKHKCRYNHVYSQTPNSHLNGRGCPECKDRKLGKLKAKEPTEYYNECKSKCLDLPINPYKNANTKIKHRCSKGHTYSQRPHDHLQGYGCPICNESHGEKYIRNYLDNHSIKYIPQKKFHDLKDKTYLSYDFYLPDYNTLIEYQGIQHYQSVSFNGKDYSNLEKQQEHDNLKRKYAKDNGYKLLELKYTLDTQELVDKYLKRRIRG